MTAEGTFFAQNAAQAESIGGQVARLIRNLSFRTATDEHQGYEVEVRPYVGKKRTLTQNAAIHKYCEMLAHDLNEAGYELHIESKVLKEPLTVPWTKETVKEHIWHTVQIALTEKQSSAELGTKEVNIIYQAISRRMAEAFGVTTPFPTRFGE